MAKPAPEYELILMLDPELPDDRRDGLAQDARKRIEAGAELRQERSWGLRKMAYEIQQRTEADYRFFRFANGKDVLDDLSHSLKIADGVLRFRIFKVDPRSPVIDPPPPVALAATSSRPAARRGGDDRPPRGPEPAEEVPDAAMAPPAAEEAPAAPPESPPPAEEAAVPAEPAPAPVEAETSSDAQDAPDTE